MLCLGENTYTETRRHTRSDFVRSANEAGQRTCFDRKTNYSGVERRSSTHLSKIDDKVAATVLAYCPEISGDALADILFGDVNQAEKLPYTYPRDGAFADQLLA